eukprot:1846299-Ditylum_brightwellii.AAC.1
MLLTDFPTGSMIPTMECHRQGIGMNESDCVLSSIFRVLSVGTLLLDMISNVPIAHDNNMGMLTKEHHTSITPENFMRTLWVGFETAKKLIESHNAAWYQACCQTSNKKGKTCAQVYATGNVAKVQFVYSHPMRSKTEENEKQD